MRDAELTRSQTRIFEQEEGAYTTSMLSARMYLIEA